jgi:hypothetical protein
VEEEWPDQSSWGSNQDFSASHYGVLSHVLTRALRPRDAGGFGNHVCSFGGVVGARAGSAAEKMGRFPWTRCAVFLGSSLGKPFHGERGESGCLYIWMSLRFSVTISTLSHPTTVSDFLRLRPALLYTARYLVDECRRARRGLFFWKGVGRVYGL